MKAIILIKKIFLAIAIISCYGNLIFAQCTLSIETGKENYKITVNDFTQFMSNPTFNGVTYVNIDASAPCDWDLYVEPTFTSTLFTASATQDLNFFDETKILMRAVNACQTPDQDYGGGSPEPPPRISGTFDAPFSVAGPYYIIGTNAVDAPILNNVVASPCFGLSNINDGGTSTLNPTTHRFRIDFQLDFSAFPGTIITPGFYQLQVDFVMADDATGFETSRQTFTLEIEVEQILQLKMETATQLDFTYDDIKKYNAGIVKYGATILSVSSNMNWDLIAVGTSTRNDALPNNPYWDKNASFGTLAPPTCSEDIPLDALELHQYPANPFGGDDYSAAFVSPPVLLGANNVEVARGGALPVSEPPSTGAKTIAGNWDQIGGPGGGNFMGPGSYRIPGGGWNVADFRYVIDYRLTPGLPTDFPNGTPVMAPDFTCPGSYSMQVRYILSEDQ